MKNDKIIIQDIEFNFSLFQILVQDSIKEKLTDNTIKDLWDRCKEPITEYMVELSNEGILDFWMEGMGELLQEEYQKSLVD